MRLTCSFLTALLVSAGSSGIILANETPQVDLYYEALCPYSERFITEQLKPALTEFAGKIKVRLFPYGNVRAVNGHAQCQHGPKECELNRYHACALDALGDSGPVFISCLVESGSAASCLASANVPTATEKQLKECSAGPEGAALWEKVKEQSAQVPYEYVPWLVINGKHSVRF